MPVGLGSKHKLPRAYVKIHSFPWIFLRGGTAERYTGRRGGPVIWTGAVREGVFLSPWASDSERVLTNRVTYYLKRYTGVGPKLFKNIPRPPSIPSGYR